ncbi:MAG: hypothetical protein LUC87_00280 [Clostridiales bacterium]|nr:hypothetical protein [Clostridiales bacterium]
MKTCIVCGGSYVDTECPYCHFPEVSVIGDDNAPLMDYANQYRKEYLKDMKLGVLCFRWKASGEQLVLDETACQLFASGAELEQGEVWCVQEFARNPEGDALSLTLVTEKGGVRKEISVSVPNLKEPGLQQVGLRLQEQLRVSVLLRNGQKQTMSAPISLVGVE